MKKITLTCPFTGVEFDCLEDADGNIIARHALTGKEISMNYNYSIKRYNIKREFFAHVETVTFSQACEILDVSRQRISKIAATGVIQPHTVNGVQVFTLTDVLDYKKTRKVGAPAKEG